MGRFIPIGLCLVALISGCGASQGQVVAAGISTGAAVALAAANRALTHDCWASCDHGYVCDHETGVCVLPSELKVPARPLDDPDDWSDGCIEEDDGTRLCPDDPPPNEGRAEVVDGGADAPADACSAPCPDGETCPLGDAGVDCPGPVEAP